MTKLLGAVITKDNEWSKLVSDCASKTCTILLWSISQAMNFIFYFHLNYICCHHQYKDYWHSLSNHSLFKEKIIIKQVYYLIYNFVYFKYVTYLNIASFIKEPKVIINPPLTIWSKCLFIKLLIQEYKFISYKNISIYLLIDLFVNDFCQTLLT